MGRAGAHSASALLLLLLVLLRAERPRGAELTFELPDSARQCFHEDVQPGAKFSLDYQVRRGHGPAGGSAAGTGRGQRQERRPARPGPVPSLWDRGAPVCPCVGGEEALRVPSPPLAARAPTCCHMLPPPADLGARRERVWGRGGGLSGTGPHDSRLPARGQPGAAVA